MAEKKGIYIEAELLWAEEKLGEWREYIDANPINKLTDRKDLKQTKTGGSYYDVVQTIEQQIKSIRDTMKEYLALLKVVNEMREVESKKIEARGGKAVSGIMSSKMNNG